MRITKLLRRWLPIIAALSLLGGTASCIVVTDKKPRRAKPVHVKKQKHRHRHCHRKRHKRVCHRHPHRVGGHHR